MARHVRIKTNYMEPVRYSFYDLSKYIPEGQRIREYCEPSIASQMRLEEIAQRGYYKDHKGSRHDVRITFRATYNTISVFIHPDPRTAVLNHIANVMAGTKS